ncbi:MAG: sterol desaturase family protein [Pseudobacteriovorax sp.]|nr:sterol desaturase family protein [Pseudobacteriovorax sp.]
MEQLASVGSLVIMTMILSEMLINFVKKSNNYDFKDSWVNIIIGLPGSFLTKLLYNGLMFAGFSMAYEFHLFELDSGSWFFWPLALILSDFSYYWYHRAGHELRLFWGTHSIHHSSEDYNLSTAIRLSWLENSFRWMFWLPLPLVGVDPLSSMIAYLLVRYYQVWLHTQSISRVPIFEIIFTVPSHHRVHHGTNPQYIDKNYGGCLIIWDKLFGTFEPEVEPVVYGVLKPIETYNPVKVNFMEYGSLIKDVWQAKSWSHRFGYLFHKPGWSPEGPGQSLEELFQEKLALSKENKSSGSLAHAGE